MDKPTIKKSDLIKLQDDGLTRSQIAERYEVSPAEMNKYFRLLGIKSKAKKATKYSVVDDTLPVVTPVITDSTVQIS